MIALRIIVFYPLMLYKYVYVFVNTAIKQMQNGYGIDSAWYRWKSILFFITSAFEVISSRIFARESFFECSRSFLISLECIQLYGSTVRESRSIPLERIRNPRLLYPNSKLEYGWKWNWLKTSNRTDSNFILDKIQCHYIMMTRYESKGFGTEIRRRWRGTGRLSKAIE